MDAGSTHKKLEELLPEEAKYLLKAQRRCKNKKEIPKLIIKLRSFTSKQNGCAKDNDNNKENVENIDVTPSCETDNDFNPKILKVESGDNSVTMTESESKIFLRNVRVRIKNIS